MESEERRDREVRKMVMNFIVSLGLSDGSRWS